MMKSKIMFLYLGIFLVMFYIWETEGNGYSDFFGNNELGKAPKASLEDAMKRNSKFRDIAMKVAQGNSDEMDTDDIPDFIDDDVDGIIGEDYPEPTRRTESEDFGPDEN